MFKVMQKINMSNWMCLNNEHHDAFNLVNLLICEKYLKALLYSCLAISTRHNAYCPNYGEKLNYFINSWLSFIYSTIYNCILFRLCLPLTDHITKLAQIPRPLQEKTRGGHGVKSDRVYSVSLSHFFTIFWDSFSTVLYCYLLLEPPVRFELTTG